MRRRGNRKEPKGEFGREVSKYLRAREVNNNELLEALHDGGDSITESYLNYIIGGKRHAAPDLIEHICICLGIEGQFRARLHRAAAIDFGYQIGPLDDA